MYGMLLPPAVQAKGAVQTEQTRCPIVKVVAERLPDLNIPRKDLRSVPLSILISGVRPRDGWQHVGIYTIANEIGVFADSPRLHVQAPEVTRADSRGNTCRL